jgi:hypothetical protein
MNDITLIHGLNEGIVHLEDLAIGDFVRAVTNIAKMHASEKLDGANLWFGLDLENKLFTSRAGKNKLADNIYNEKDYPYFAANNGFRSAHAALKSQEDNIKQVLRPGDTVEIEVLYGRQPNAVTYGAGGKNYIAFLRGVGTTQDVIVDQLANRLTNVTTTVKVQIVDTADGENLKLEPADITFQFVGAQKIDTAHLKTTDVSIQLRKLQSFLQAKAELDGKDITNFNLITTSLGAIDKDLRPAAKALKTEILARVMNEFKLPIKKELLDKFVGRIKSPLASDDLSPDEDIGIEGVVLRDPASGEQIKLVDKDNFTTINSFNHAVRSTISGVIKTLEPGASLESRGGILGELKITIADLLGNVELARGAGAKKVFMSLKGKTPEETVRNVAAELRGNDDYRGTRRKIEALIDGTTQKLAQALKDFKANKDQYQLKLKNGKTIGLSAEILRRTLISFAEARRDITELKAKVAKTKDLTQLVALMYGRIAKAVNAAPEEETEKPEVDKPVAEGVLTEKRQHSDKSEYRGKDAATIINTYLATYLLTAVIYKEKDKPGLRLSRDKMHMRLQRFDVDMSALNFWGYVVWRSGTPAVKKLLSPGVAAALHKITKKVPPTLWRFLHVDLSYGREVPIQWEDHIKVFKLLQFAPGLNMERINTLLHGIYHYDELTFDGKVKLLGKLFYFVQQYVGLSPLAYRLRQIQNNLLLNANGQNDNMLQELTLIRKIVAIQEDDAAAPIPVAGAVPTGATAATNSTNMGAVSSLPLHVGAQKRVIIKRQRNPKINRLKFPDPSKDKK